MEREHEARMMRASAAMIRKHVERCGAVMGPSMVLRWSAVADSKERLAAALELPALAVAS